MNISKYCINLIEREDRYDHCVNEFKKVEFFNDIKFIRNHRHPTSGRIGCFESHIQVIKDALYKGADYAFIFEDDFVFCNKDIQGLLKMLDKHKMEFTISQKRMLLYIDEKVDKDLYTCSSLGLTFYIVSRKAMITILENYNMYKDLHVDIFYNKLRIDNKLKMYCYKPIVQSTCFSSDNNWSDKFIFQLYQKISERTNIHEKALYYYSYYIPKSNKKKKTIDEIFSTTI